MNNLADLKQQLTANRNDPKSQAAMRKTLQETKKILEDLDEKRKFPPEYFDQVVHQETIN